MPASLWWIDEPMIAGCSNPDFEVLLTLQREHFAGIVCLLEIDRQSPAYDVEKVKASGYSWLNVPVRDFSAPTLQQIQEFIQFVEMVKTDDRKVLVHCLGGIGRTGTMAAAYWIDRGVTVENAIERIRRVRPFAVETEEQETRLKEFSLARSNR